MANHLEAETSPYLRQHKDNPVDWYPWGDEPFELALKQDRPVFVSIGYSSCHWCHVMAHECFEDPQIARYLNEHFVSVKVDREERPDVDGVYMEATQAMTGGGGWPMSVFVTGDRKPFFAGTYFPPRDRQGLPGFPRVLEAVIDAWENNRSNLIEQANALTAAIQARSGLAVVKDKGGRATPASLEARELINSALTSLAQRFDETYGGFGGAPKFPQAPSIDLLLAGYALDANEECLTMAARTLDAMSAGGIYDHLGGGFSRYSVDRAWQVPHFEKMLYDQASLLRVYLHGWLLTGNANWHQVVQETVTYVLSDLRGPHGGLWSSEDADSEGEEGRFYLWSADEIADAVGNELAQSAVLWYGVTTQGNFEGRNILHRPEPGQLLRPGDIELARSKLATRRSSRVRPALDDKVITEWNAMFASSLAEAASATGRRDWAEATEGIMTFLLENLRRSDGRLLRAWRDGQAKHLAYAGDYAWMVDALVRTAELTGEKRWLEEACEMAEQMIALFWDPETRAFSTTGADGEKLISRQVDLSDGATPASNSVAAVALMRLGMLTAEQRFSDPAIELLASIAPAMALQPSAFSYAMGAVRMAFLSSREIVVVGDRPDLVQAARTKWLPDAVLAWGEPTGPGLWSDREPGMAYVCHQFTCLAPASHPEELLAQLQPA